MLRRLELWRQKLRQPELRQPEELWRLELQRRPEATRMSAALACS